MSYIFVQNVGRFFCDMLCFCDTDSLLFLRLAVAAALVIAVFLCSVCHILPVMSVAGRGCYKILKILKI